MERREQARNIEQKVLEHLTDRPDLCGDNTHDLACEMIYGEFGIALTPDMVKCINSIERAKRKVLAKYPEMDMRTTHRKLEQEDREYYSENV